MNYSLRSPNFQKKPTKGAIDTDQKVIQNIEEEIDNLSSQLWGLCHEELKEIKLCLKEISE